MRRYLRGPVGSQQRPLRRSLDEVARAGGRVVRGAAEGNAVVVAELLAAHRGERQDRAARRRLHHSFTLMIQGESYRLKQSTPEHLEMRQTSSRAIMGEFKAWLDAQQARQPPMGPMGEAIGYALGQWHALTLYLTDPHLPIDNNAPPVPS